MKRIFPAVLIAVLAILISSCGVSPEEALQNIQNPNVEFKTSLKIPLAATRVNTDDLVVGYVEEFLGEIPGATLIEDEELKIGYSTQVYFMNPEDIQNIREEIRSIKGEENVVDYSLEIPGISGFSKSVSVTVPEIEGQNVTITLPLVPAGDYEATSQEIILPFSAGDVSSISVSGSVLISVTIPESWEGTVTVTGISATVTSGDETLASGEYGVSENSASIPISGDIDSDISIEFSLKINSTQNIYESGEINVDITPQIEIKAVKGLRLNIEEPVDLPENVKEATIVSGRMVISSTQLEFIGVDGNVGGNPIEVSDGKLVVDLSDVSLPSTVVINSVDASINTDDLSEVSIEGDIEDLRADVLLDVGEGLSYEGSETIELPEDAKYIKRMKFKSGFVNLVYDSKLPVGFDLRIWSEDLPIDVSTSIEPGESGTIEVLNLENLPVEVEGTSLTIEYSVTPKGYDEETGELLIENLELSGGEVGIVATITYGNMDIEEIVLGGIDVGATRTLDLSGMEDLSSVISGLDISGTLTSNLDIDAMIHAKLLGISDGEVTASSELTLEFEGGNASLDELFETLKKILSESPEMVEYSASLVLDSATLNLDELSEDGAWMRVDLESPLRVDLESSTLVYTYDSSQTFDLPEEFTLNGATITLEGTNTSGLRLLIEVYKADERLGEFDLDETVSGNVSIDEETFEKIASGEPITVKVWMKSGEQRIRRGGELELSILLDADLTVKTGGGERK